MGAVPDVQHDGDGGERVGAPGAARTARLRRHDAQVYQHAHAHTQLRGDHARRLDEPEREFLFSSVFPCFLGFPSKIRDGVRRREENFSVHFVVNAWKNMHYKIVTVAILGLMPVLRRRYSTLFVLFNIL